MVESPKMSERNFDNEVSLLEVRPETENAWFSRFELLGDDSLTKNLILVAVMGEQAVITAKETT